MNWKARLHIAIGIIIWSLPVIGYVGSIGLMIKLFWMPLFALYGFWSTIGLVIGCSAIAWLSAAFFWYLMANTRKPQAIYRGHKHETS